MNTLFEQPSTGSGFGNQRVLVSVCGPLLLLLGTGGHGDVHALRQYPAQSFTTPAPEATPAPTATAQSIAERVTAIKAAFGLTISQLAKVLGVERQTIYDWMDEEHPRQIQGYKQKRLAAMQRLAVQWNQLCPWPTGKGMATYAVDGDTLLELLSADALDETRLQTVMRGLSEQVKAEWKRKEERSLAHRLRKQGFQPVRESSVRSALAGFCRTVSLNDDDA